MLTDMNSLVPDTSPFEDPTPALNIPKSESSNSETNPFRVRNTSGVNASSNNTPSTPVLSIFPPAAPINVPVTSPAPKSKNPFLDLPVEDDSGPKVPPKKKWGGEQRLMDIDVYETGHYYCSGGGEHRS
jgi:hypothetical protein